MCNEYENRRERERREAIAAIGDLCDRLTRLEVSRVEIDYDGQGDEGSVEEVRYISGEVELASELPHDITSLLTDAAEALAPDGYEINDGGYGTLIIHIPDRRAELEHNQRYVDVRTDTEEWSF
jgi:hypothetical protein